MELSKVGVMGEVRTSVVIDEVGTVVVMDGVENINGLG